MQQPPTTPHYLGLLLALVSGCLLGAWLWRTRRAAPLGARHRMGAALAAAALTTVAVFGNGVSGHYAATTFPGGVLGPYLRGGVSQVAADEALRTALSAPFLRYASSLDARFTSVQPEAMRRSLTLHQLPCSALAAHRITLSPAPPAGARCLMLEHYDAINFGLHLLGRHAAHDARAHFAQALALQYLPELAPLALYRNATDDATRLRALGALNDRPLILAEWHAREIARFVAATPPPSPAVRAALEDAQSLLHLALRDPTRRGLPRGFRAALP